MQAALKRTAKMATMFEIRPKIRELINKFARKFFDMAQSENFDVRTIEFEAIVPHSDERKIVLTLQKANYLTAPIKHIPPHKDTVSYKLIRNLQSFYSSFLGGNEWVEGLIDQCPGFCDCIFSIAAYLLEVTGGHTDVRKYDIVCGDNAAGDLCFYITFDC